VELGWLKSLIYGFIGGLTEILPVSAQAHKALMLKFFGIGISLDLLNLAVHFGVFAALYFTFQSQLVRFGRARALARVPKQKRKRPLDTRTLMDWSLLKTMLIPVVLGLLLYRKGQGIGTHLVALAGIMFLNGLILYIPQFLPSSNRDSRTLSRLEGFLMGLGGAASVVPGISAVGTAASIGSVCGVEKSYGLNMALMMNMFLMFGLMVYDVLGVIGNGLIGFSFQMVLQHLLAAAAAFGAALLGVKLLRYLIQEHSLSVFAFYSVGLALFTFVLNLIA